MDTVEEAGMTITLEQQIKSVRREIAMRERVYPAWVRGGKMKQENADYEIEAMKSVAATLETLLHEKAAQAWA